jgi:hypothetical protein
MARIRSARHGDVLQVTVSGRLSVGDMGRLEHACASALTSQAADLDLDLRRVTHIDASASALLERISQRGARITHPLQGQLNLGTERMSRYGGPRKARTGERPSRRSRLWYF